MKRIMLIVLTLCVFATLNVAIHQKEQIRRDGETVFLELAPVDPRSLMQGDYMRLSYAIEGQIPRDTRSYRRQRGQVVITVDENSVAQFVRMHKGERLQPGEKLIHYDGYSWFPSIRPNSFFFEEGQGAVYQSASYGEFKFGSNGDYILVGLAAKDRTPIGGAEQQGDQQPAPVPQ